MKITEKALHAPFQSLVPSKIKPLSYILILEIIFELYISGILKYITFCILIL